MRETFLVREEGVEACAASRDLTEWPYEYRLGVLNGLLFNDHEQLTVSEWLASVAGRVVAPVPELEEHITELADRVEAALTGTGIDWGLRARVSETLLAGSTVLPADSQQTWRRLADVIEPRPPF